MKDYLKKLGVDEEFYIKSSATGTWELTNPVHYGTKRVLSRLNISCEGKISELLRANDYDNYDYFIGMDESNRRAMKRLFNGDKDNKVSLLLDYTENPRDVADPYYTGNFEDTYRDISQGISALYKKIGKKQ